MDCRGDPRIMWIFRWVRQNPRFYYYLCLQGQVLAHMLYIAIDSMELPTCDAVCLESTAKHHPRDRLLLDGGCGVGGARHQTAAQQNHRAKKISSQTNECRILSRGLAESERGRSSKL